MMINIVFCNKLTIVIICSKEVGGKKLGALNMKPFDIPPQSKHLGIVVQIHLIYTLVCMIFFLIESLSKVYNSLQSDSIGFIRLNKVMC